MQDIKYNRDLELNAWIISARWFYMVAVFLIGILGNSLIGVINKRFSVIGIFILLLVLVAANTYFYNTLEKIKQARSLQKLKMLGVWQIGLELAIFSILMFVFEDWNIVGMFFFLPIISASIIFGISGALIVALLAGAIINLPVVVNYFMVLFHNYVPNRILQKEDIVSFYYLTVSLIQTIVTSNFYIVFAVFAGYTSKLLYAREQQLVSSNENYQINFTRRENEYHKLGHQAEQLTKKDAVLTAINKELDKKVKELEISEKSMLKAFSDLKEARKKSEQESNKITAMIANFVDPVIVIDSNHKLSLLNPVAKDMFGLIENDIGTIVADDNHYSMSNFKALIKKDYTVKTSKELKSGNPLEEEVTLSHNGQELTYKVITERIVDNLGNELGVMKIFYNLTREKMIDKLKSEFISIAAHQLRTPLSAIKWVIKMVLDGDVGEMNKEQKELLEKGYQSNERIIVLVNDMLNVSRIEEGRFGYSFSQSDFKEALNIVLDSLEKPIKDRNIKMVLNIPDNPQPVYMDKDKMSLVLQNLLENAVKYTPEYGRIEVGLEYGKELLTLRVKDNGVGIPAKDQAKLFSKFFRADNVIRMQTEGSGLGMFIVKNIIERHNGDIQCISEEGKGTEFIVTLPLK